MSALTDFLRSLLTAEKPAPRDPNRELRGPLGTESTDGYGRRILTRPDGSVAIVEESGRQPDFYLDPARRKEYYDYMANLPDNDSSENQKRYYQEQSRGEQSMRDAGIERLIRLYGSRNR